MEEFELVHSGDEISKLSVEKENELIQERERVKLLLAEMELLRGEKKEQETLFNGYRDAMRKSLIECHETIQELIKERVQKNENEKELKEKLSKYLEENVSNEIEISKLKKNLSETENKVNEDKKKMIEKESQIMKLKVNMAVSIDLASRRDERQITELLRKKEEVQAWSQELAKENGELRAQKENAENELKKVVLRYQKQVLCDFLQKLKRLALPHSENSQDTNKDRIGKFFVDQTSLKEENVRLNRVNTQLKQQLRETQFELNNMEISDFLIMLENQTDHQYFNNLSLQRKDLLKQNIHGVLTGIRQLCDHRNINMEFTI